MTVKLSTKGQLVIPKEIRDRAGWKPGLELVVEERDGEIVLRPAVDLPEKTLAEVMGCIPYDGPPRSLEEMEEAIARGARESR